ncbi:MAG: hypothetical protein JWP22_1015 [Ramlibacter sp.]|nr:hypothetical protein [Ramlibacter sp.]
MMKSLLVLFALFGLSAGAGAQTAWPDATADNQPGASHSARSVRLPADVKLMSARADPAGAHAAWSGGWRGWGCPAFTCDVALVVEEARGDEATVVIAAAGSELDLSERVQARFVGDELQARLADGSTMQFRQRADGNVDFLWRRRADWVAGVLGKDDSTLEQREAEARRWLARDTLDVKLVQPWQAYSIRVRPAARSSSFIADAGDACLGARVPTDLRFVDPYLVMEFAPTLGGCNFKVQYRAHPVTGKAWAFRQDNGESSWRRIARQADIALQR